jgi:hypothetical protein
MPTGANFSKSLIFSRRLKNLLKKQPSGANTYTEYFIYKHGIGVVGTFLKVDIFWSLSSLGSNIA